MAMSTLDTIIKPEDIDTDRRIWEAFGHRETEVSARWIVRFCQARGEGWEPIPLDELDKFYMMGDTLLFNRLTTEKYVTVENGMVTLTKRFVMECRRASPVIR
jgi:hypothetical protein